MAQLVDGQYENDHVNDNVDGRAEPALQMHLIAVPMVPLLQLQPRMVDRPALEQGGEEEGDSKRDAETHGGPDGPLQRAMLENAQQEQEDSDLVHGLCWKVEEFTNKVVLRMHEIYG